MNIYNLDDHKIYRLSMIDPKTGDDCVVDWVGDLALTKIHWNEELERYEADGPEINWWIEMMTAHQATYDRIHEARIAYGPDAVDDVLSKLEPCDFEHQPEQIYRAFIERFGIIRWIKLF